MPRQKRTPQRPPESPRRPKPAILQLRHELARPPFLSLLSDEMIAEMREGDPREQFGRYQEVLGVTAQVNSEWVRRTYRAIRDAAPVVDCIDVSPDDKGRWTITGKWATIVRRPGESLPAYSDSFMKIVKEGKPHYMFVPNDSAQIFFGNGSRELVRDTFRAPDGGEPLEIIQYSPDGALWKGYVPPGMLTRARGRILQLCEMGYWAIHKDEKPSIGFGFNRIASGAAPPADAKPEVAAYLPKVKIKDHPVVGTAHATINSRGATLLTGRSPVDERGPPVYRFEVPAAEGGDFIDSFFGAYNSDANLSGFPPLLYYTAHVKGNAPRQA